MSAKTARRLTVNYNNQVGITTNTDMETTYPERAGALARCARKTACETAGEHWLAAQAAASAIGDLEIKCVNELREAGESINRASGRDQLLFSLEGKEFCRKELLPLLPPGMGMDQVRACCHIASHVKKPIQTREELRALKQEMQMAFKSLGMIESTKRPELQSAVTRNLFSDWVNKSTGLYLVMDELEKEEPMDRWTPEKLDEFLETSLPMKERILRAERLRLGTENALSGSQRATIVANQKARWSKIKSI